jgi:lysine 2,3-aminomutase
MDAQTPVETLTSADEPPLLAEAPASAAPPSPAPFLARLSDLRESSKWNDWRWQIRHRIRTGNELVEFFPSLKSNPTVRRVAAKYPLAITPYYAALIRTPDFSDPVFQMSVPRSDELFDPPFLHADPLKEEEDMPVPGLVHRYRDRALVIATTMCSMYCRHCTRKRVAGTRETAISVAQLKQITRYLQNHPEITDVIVSGGDPLTMSTSLLERILMAIRTVPTVQILRIGTRTPVVLPQRITAELTQMLAKYHPLWINTHFNHPNEITAESAAACARLANAGIPLGNQSVLLREINDTPQVMEELCRSLVRMRVRPYYLFQCDLVRGIEHFRTPLSRGIEIMEYLRGRLSGLAIPAFVVDTPHGGGKIPLLPNYVVSVSPTHTVLRNFEGLLVNYPEPVAASPSPAAPTHAPDEAAGVWELATGKGSVITPATAARPKRRAARRAQRAAVDAHPEFAEILSSLM